MICFAGRHRGSSRAEDWNFRDHDDCQIVQRERAMHLIKGFLSTSVSIRVFPPNQSRDLAANLVQVSQYLWLKCWEITLTCVSPQPRTPVWRCEGTGWPEEPGPSTSGRERGRWVLRGWELLRRSGGERLSWTLAVTVTDYKPQCGQHFYRTEPAWPGWRSRVPEWPGTKRHWRSRERQLLINQSWLPVEPSLEFLHLLHILLLEIF